MGIHAWKVLADTKELLRLLNLRFGMHYILNGALYLVSRIDTSKPFPALRYRTHSLVNICQELIFVRSYFIQADPRMRTTSSPGITQINERMTTMVFRPLPTQQGQQTPEMRPLRCERKLYLRPSSQTGHKIINLFDGGDIRVSIREMVETMRVNVQRSRV